MGQGLHRGFTLWGRKWREVAQITADLAIRDRSRGVTGRDQSIERREHGSSPAEFPGGIGHRTLPHHRKNL